MEPRGCNRPPLPEGAHGKQGVCDGLPVVVGPLPAKEGVDACGSRKGLPLAAAIRARTPVATATCAYLTDHSSTLSTSMPTTPH